MNILKFYNNNVINNNVITMRCLIHTYTAHLAHARARGQPESSLVVSRRLTSSRNPHLRIRPSRRAKWSSLDVRAAFT